MVGKPALTITSDFKEISRLEILKKMHFSRVLLFLRKALNLIIAFSVGEDKGPFIGYTFSIFYRWIFL